MRHASEPSNGNGGYAMAFSDECAKPALITGGAGFIGTNLADRLASLGRRVLIYDNLSRPGVEMNLAHLKRIHGDLIETEIADVRDEARVQRSVTRASVVFHLAAQVAVTTSLNDPRHDFTTNVAGTFNVLEAVRRQPKPPPLLFTSTNKVYGRLDHLKLSKVGDRYAPEQASTAVAGIDESAPLEFHSPYGCSKGAADQYVLDYARCFGVPAVVFRMSCIYGRYQKGNEDQGWIAHFLLRALRNEPLTIFGDGGQVRDILYAEDLVNAMLAAAAHIDRVKGQPFNIGGGPQRTISLLELMALIARLHGRLPRVRYSTWRTGDQRYYVTNTQKFSGITGWRPRVSVEEGVASLYAWLRESQAARSPARVCPAPNAAQTDTRVTKKQHPLVNVAQAVTRLPR